MNEVKKDCKYILSERMNLCEMSAGSAGAMPCDCICECQYKKEGKVIINSRKN